jgi:hypothetical protein
MKDLNVKYLRILRLRFGLVEIVIFYAPAKKETVANASGSERCVLIPWLFLGQSPLPENQIVISMGSNPKPNQSVLCFYCKGPKP